MRMRASAGALRAPAGVRVIAAAVAMVAVAELAVIALSPGAELLAPLPVDAADYFSQAHLDRAAEYRDGQRWLGLAGMVLELGALAGLAFGRPRALRRALERADRRPLRGAAFAGAAVALTAGLATLPTRIAAHERAVDFGLSSQGLAGWLWDVARSTAISVVLLALAAIVLLALVRRFPRRWWIPGAGAVAVLAAVFVGVAPVVLAPVFNDFEPLPADSRARAEVLELGERAGVDIGEVYSVDASRRVTSLNAYVDGLGPSKRVVLYDNLLAEAARSELRSVVAHELGHVANDDLPRGLAYISLVAPLGLLFARELGRAIAERSGIERGGPAAVPAYLFAIWVAVLVLNVPGNQLSREVEASADLFALELTGDPQGLIDLQQRLARANLGDPDPPAAATALLATHPPASERIGAALAFARDR